LKHREESGVDETLFAKCYLGGYGLSGCRAVNESLLAGEIFGLGDGANAGATSGEAGHRGADLLRDYGLLLSHD
jgi:hypothetical protein